MTGLEVAVVGGGIAGMYLAYILKKHGLKVLVLEASGRIGGRILTLRDFANIPLEAGAAYVHGRHSVLYELASFRGITLVREEAAPYFLAEGRVYSRKEALDVCGFELIDERLINCDFQGEGLLSEQPAPPGWQGIWQGLAAIYGTTAERLTLEGLREKSSLWSSGDTNFLIPNGYDTLLAEFCGFLKDNIQLNSPVHAIVEHSSGYQIYTPFGQIEASAVAVCVPLGVLKAGILRFEPSLPPDKIRAINELGFDRGAKVFLKFSQRFWPAQMGELYGGEVCALYSVRSALPPCVLEAFLMGKKAALLSSDSAISKLLCELDEAFESKASAFFMDAKVYDWGADPWIRGAYTYPVSDSHRLGQIIAEPYGRLFFAGEHTHPGGHQGTVHGAMESAELTAKKILES